MSFSTETVHVSSILIQKFGAESCPDTVSSSAEVVPSKQRAEGAEDSNPKALQLCDVKDEAEEGGRRHHQANASEVVEAIQLQQHI